MLLTFVYLVLIFGIISLIFIPLHKENWTRLFALSIVSAVLIISSIIFVFFNNNNSSFQFLTEFNFLNSNVINIDFSFGLDGISIYFFF
jgi:NADH:ubiquinone oxidoreductase subunit 4 (subunit M)